jgi:hypothetical protein
VISLARVWGAVKKIFLVENSKNSGILLKHRLIDGDNELSANMETCESSVRNSFPEGHPPQCGFSSRKNILLNVGFLPGTENSSESSSRL